MHPFLPNDLDLQWELFELAISDDLPLPGLFIDLLTTAEYRDHYERAKRARFAAMRRARTLSRSVSFRVFEESIDDHFTFLIGQELHLLLDTHPPLRPSLRRR